MEFNQNGANLVAVQPIYNATVLLFIHKNDKLKSLKMVQILAIPSGLIT